MTRGYSSFSPLIHLDCRATDQIRADWIVTGLVWPPKKYPVFRATVKGLLSSSVLPPTPWWDTQVTVVCLPRVLYAWLLRELPDFSYSDEFSLEPAVIFQSFINTNFLSLQFHLGMVDIGILSWWMISPDNDILYIIRSDTKFKSNLVK